MSGILGPNMIAKSKGCRTYHGWLLYPGLIAFSFLSGNQSSFVGEQDAPLLAIQAQTLDNTPQQQQDRTTGESSQPIEAQPAAGTDSRSQTPAPSSRNQTSRPPAQQRRPASSRRPSTSAPQRRPPGTSASSRTVPRRQPRRPPAEPVAKYTELELKAMAADIDRLSVQLEALNHRTTGRLESVTPGKRMPSGEQFRFEGDYRRMVQLQRQLADNPDDFETLLTLGNLLQRNYKFQQAENYLLNALALQPLHQGLLSNLADLYLKKGEYTKAWEAFQEVIYLNPDNIDAHAAQGRIRELEGNFSGAEAIYRRIEEQYGNVAQVYAHRTLNLAGQGTYGEAIALARAGIALYPDHALLYYARGRAYQGLGLVDRARTDYYDALALDPDMIAAYFAIGEVALREKNAVTAIKVHLRILDMYPGDPNASLGLGKGYLMDLRFPEAVAELEMLRHLHPEFHSAKEWLAQAYFLRSLQLQEQGYSKDAIDMYRKAIYLAGSASTELAVAALLLAGNGALSHDDYSLAAAYFEFALENDPFHLEGYLGLGNALKALGELTKARSTFQQALIIDPDHPDARMGFDQLSRP